MLSLSNRYAALKKKIGGNREIMRYEETFGMPREEFEHITPPAPHIRRILGELDFAIRLSESEESRFDALIADALTLLEEELAQNGVLTKAAASSAETLLLPMKDAAKAYKLILAGHAHIDMNWMWSWHETVAATLATFRTMIDIMEEYPDFCFSQSQGAVYRIVEEYDPALAEKIKERIKEGRWEVTAAAWVETDKNMPNTESLLHHISYTKTYMKEHWDVDPASLEVDFSPDTFGHSANIPEIDRFGGVNYYYHCRALDGNQALYRWQSPSGKELLCYREQYWYNSGITPKIGAGILDIAKRSAGFKTGLIVYGVGDHGGGPTRRDVERAYEMMDWAIFPTIRFGTLREFFKEAECVRDHLPLVTHELNYFAPGCYTTQSRLKMANRASERALSYAEAMAVMASPTGATLPKTLDKAWENTLFTHFHDILTGSCVQDSREHAMGLFSEAMAASQSAFGIAAAKLAETIDTSAIAVRETDIHSQAEGAGAGYGINGFSSLMPRPERGNGLCRIFTLFNPTAVPRHEAVEITVWDWVGDLRYLAVTDAEGNPLPFQKLDGRLQTYWDHKYFRFLVYAEVPAYGYTTVIVDEAQNTGAYPLYYQPEHRTGGQDFKNFVLENEYIRAEFDCGTGELVSLKAIGDDREYLRKGARGGLRLVDTERASSSAWSIGNYLNKTPINQAVRSTAIGRGSIRQGFYTEYKIRQSTVKMTVTLDRNQKAFAVSLEVDWHEIGGDTVPVLTYEIPLEKADGYRYDIPAGSILRESRNQDVPALQYGAALFGDTAVSMINESKYGYRATHAGDLITTFINSSTSPDPYPERGIHKIRMGIGLLPNDPKTLEDTATAFNNGITYLAMTRHSGTRQMTDSLFTFDSKASVVSALLPTASGFLLRVYNTADTPDTVTVGIKATAAIGTDLSGNPLNTPVTLSPTCVSATLPPFSLCNIEITL
ncbi:MAG: alpha-mannosidase [Clostridia bacterium]|nr:alpha-mannosidase [Clostridia bacterium]